MVLLKEGEPLEDDQSVLYIPRPVAKVFQLLLLCGVQHVSLKSNLSDVSCTTDHPLYPKICN